MAVHWLKAVGMGESKTPVADNWRTHVNGLLSKAVFFSRRPSLRHGDDIVLYAAGTGLVFAIAEARGFPHRRSDVDKRWPWVIEVTYVSSHTRDFVHEGVPLSDLEANGRSLRQAIRQKSHIRLTGAEYEAAMRVLAVHH